MNRLVPVDHRIAFRREGLAKRHLRIELLAILIEVDDAQSLRAIHFALVRRKLSVQDAQQRRFSASVRAD